MIVFITTVLLSFNLNFTEAQPSEFPFSVSVYPNPCKGEFNIELWNATKLIKIRLYNMLGELIFEKNLEDLPQNTTVMAGSSLLDNGAYTLLVLSDEGDQRLIRIVVEK